MSGQHLLDMRTYTTTTTSEFGHNEKATGRVYVMGTCIQKKEDIRECYFVTSVWGLLDFDTLKFGPVWVRFP